ncbi:LuxR C-terminal-related transcriptional regulator [Ruania halotolerans]|uniref:LuxR C-terminal-related transcriptional regulator n=1 Tax=Ruania halotolerans TaxID=2897773 RepID=UPI001E331110|nr:LuxR C-terminal-related transcriptional regulator [Ruania halotolerans]UFU05739.1 LuxR C-terminal-related transcriptional regulator [Ruania halotolerans]
MPSEPQRPLGMPRLPRDSEFSDDVLAMLATLRPLTVLRGPRGYGKTSLLARWLESADDLPHAVYIALSMASNQDEGFWTQVAANLAAAGLLTEDFVMGAGAQSAVTRALASLTEPLLLIIDDMHEAGLHDDPERIDDLLVDLVRRNENLYLVVAGRTVREIETVGSLSVDSVLIGPRELRLTGASVYRLARRLGVDLTLDGAQQVAVDLGGWPSAIRAGLTHSAGNGSGDIDTELVENYIIAMVRDLRFEKMRSFLLRTAIPEEFDLEMARAIVPKGHTARMLRNVHDAGLISERRTVNGVMYSFAPATRAALLRVMRDSCPEIEREVHHALVRLWEGKNEPARVLSHAVQAGEWELALDVLEHDWVRLLVEDPLTLIEAARQFPASMVAENPRLRVAVDHLDGALPPRGRSARWRDVDSPTLQAEMVTHHEQLTQHGEDVLLVLLQWGLTSMLQGRLDVALYAFAQARAVGMRDHENVAVAHLGAAGLALVHALQGEPSSALRWLAEFDGALTPSDGVVGEVAAVAKALAYVDSASDRAAEAVRALPELHHRDELWALGVFIRAHYAVLTERREEIVALTSELRAAVRYIRPGSRTEALLSESLIEALLFSGNTDVARQVVERFEPQRLVRVGLAKLAMKEHAYDDVVRIATEVLDAWHVTRRHAMECYVLMAGSHFAAGRGDAARAAFNAATDIARQTGQRRPFLLMRRYVFQVLTAGDAEMLGLWPGAREPGGHEQSGVASLTAREGEVLRALEDYPGAAGIARALGMSSNTVKTHLRAIYRKLGAANRAEALAAARSRG